MDSHSFGFYFDFCLGWMDGEMRNCGIPIEFPIKESSVAILNPHQNTQPLSTASTPQINHFLNQGWPTQIGLWAAFGKFSKNIGSRPIFDKNCGKILKISRKNSEF